MNKLNKNNFKPRTFIKNNCDSICKDNCNMNDCNKCYYIVNNNNCYFLDKGPLKNSFKFTIHKIDYVFKINFQCNEDTTYIIYDNILDKHILFDNLIYYKSNNY